MHIKAQINQDRCVKLSPAEEFSLNSKDPYDRIFTNIKLKFHSKAYEFLERGKEINKVLLQDIFSVAAGKCADEEILKTSIETKFTNNIIVIMRTSALPITMCISIASESVDHSKDSILLKYSYCLTVLSIGKALSVDAITACYEEGIVNRTIVDIQGDGIAETICDLVRVNNGLIGIADISNKSRIVQRQVIFGLYDTDSATCRFQLKESGVYAEFKELKIEKTNSDLTVFRYEYIGSMSQPLSIRLIHENRNNAIFDLNPKELSLQTIQSQHFIFNVRFDPTSHLFSDIFPPGDPIKSSIMQLSYFWIHMMEEYKTAFIIDMLIDDYELFCGKTPISANDQMVACKLIGRYISESQVSIEETDAEKCLVMISYFDLKHLSIYRSDAAYKILGGIHKNHNILVQFKNSRHFSKRLRGLAYQIIKIKNYQQYNIEKCDCLRFVGLIEDENVIKDFCNIFVKLVSEYMEYAECVGSTQCKDWAECTEFTPILLLIVIWKFLSSIVTKKQLRIVLCYTTHLARAPTTYLILLDISKLLF